MATNIGFMYFFGNENFPRNLEAGIFWWEKGAEQGVVPCLANLGYVYHDGNGVSKDYRLAAKWLQKAADAGSGKAMFSLAWMYAEGAGVPKDAERAFRLMKQASEAGETRAFNDLGFFCQRGFGTKQDFNSAAYYFGRAYEEGDPNGKKNLEAIGKGYMVAHIEEKRRMKSLREDLKEEANSIAEGVQGDNELIAKAKEYGKYEGPRNQVMAELLMEIAAERGNADAQYQVGYQRHLMDVTDKGAVELIKKAAEQGQPQALCCVGDWYEKGWSGCPKDKEQAIALWERAAAGGSLEAEEKLKKAKRFEGVGKKLSGLFGRREQADSAPQTPAAESLQGVAAVREAPASDLPPEAAALKEKADAGDAESQRILGIMYINGNEIPQDRGQAIHYLALAANQGDRAAENVLLSLNEGS